MKKRNKIKDLRKEFPSCTDIGLYPLIYNNDKGDVFCSLCAIEIYLNERVKCSSNIYWEGPVIFCECGEEIESAYGEH